MVPQPSAPLPHGVPLPPPNPLPPRSRPRRSAGKDSGRRTSNYRGVSFHKPSGKWRVRIKVGSQEVRLGYFATELDAAKRYDQAARQYHGADAWLNFGEEGEVPAAAVETATHKAASCQPASAAARASAGRQRKQKKQLLVDVNCTAAAQQQHMVCEGPGACGLGPRQPSSGSVATTTPPATPGSPTSVLGATASGAATATASAQLPPACFGESASSKALAAKAVAMPLLVDDRAREAFLAASLLLGMR